jgi:hypothetical protein
MWQWWLLMTMKGEGVLLFVYCSLYYDIQAAATPE